MKLNQFFFFNFFFLEDKDFNKKKLNHYNFNKSINYYNWWFYVNNYNFYKNVSAYKPFIKDVNMLISFKSSKKSQSNFIYTDYISI